MNSFWNSFPFFVDVKYLERMTDKMSENIFHAFHGLELEIVLHVAANIPHQSS